MAGAGPRLRAARRPARHAAAAAVAVAVAAARGGAPVLLVEVGGARASRADDARRRIGAARWSGGCARPDSSARRAAGSPGCASTDGWIDRARCGAGDLSTARRPWSRSSIRRRSAPPMEAEAGRSRGAAARRAATAAVAGRARGHRARGARRSPIRIAASAGRVAARRALAGIDPGGEASGGRRAGRRPARRRGRDDLGSSARDAGARPSPGQALPLVLGGILALVVCTLALAAIGGAVTGKSRAQRAADLAALSAAR